MPDHNLAAQTDCKNTVENTRDDDSLLSRVIRGLDRYNKSRELGRKEYRRCRQRFEMCRVCKIIIEQLLQIFYKQLSKNANKKKDKDNHF